MPGAPWRGRSKPLAERSLGELVVVFMILPVLFGGFTMFMVVKNAATHAANFTVGDWLGQVVAAGLLGLGAAVTLPAVAYQEIRRRRRERMQRKEG